jgi:glycosyltransferase involved in cell wall biosynthesis
LQPARRRAELVVDGVTGLHFKPGHAADLAAKVLHLNGNPTVRVGMRAAALRAFETHYTADVNYRSLLKIYHQAIQGEGSAHRRLA